MTRILTLLSLLALLSPARAQEADLAAKKTKLKKAAEAIEQISNDEYIEVFRNPGPGRHGNRRYFASRPAALESVYGSLAALEYKESLSAGLPEASRQEAEAALASRDAESVAIDPASLQESGWWGDFSQSVNAYIDRQPEPRSRITAVAAVRGGRTIPTESDKKAAKLRKDIEETGASLASAETPERKAELHLEAGRMYDKLAALIKEPPAAKAPISAAPTASPAAAAPAAAELSPRQIYQNAGPAVVLLLCAGKDGNGELGTGSIIDEKGRIITNAHVVIRGSTGQPFETIRVYLKPAKVTGDSKQDLVDPLTARVVTYDRALDLALLELTDPPASLKTLPIGDSSAVEAGESVVAIGHPEQGGLWTLTQGVVSTVIADLGGVKGKDAFQTDASINRGNSGGPLISRGGAMIGVNTSMARKAPDGLTITSVNFSVKSDVVKTWLASAPNKVDYSAPAEAPAPPAAPAAPAADAPAPAPAPITAPAPAKPAPQAAQAPKILTPAKPFNADELLAREMKEMEDMGDEMHEDIQRRMRQMKQP